MTSNRGAEDDVESGSIAFALRKRRWMSRHGGTEADGGIMPTFSGMIFQMTEG